MKKLLLLATIGALWAAPSFARQVRAVVCGVVLDRAPGVKEIVSGDYIFLLAPEKSLGTADEYERRVDLILSLHAADRVCLDGIFLGGRGRIFVPMRAIDGQIL